MRPSRVAFSAAVLAAATLSAQTFTLQPDRAEKTMLTHTAPLAEGARLTVKNLNGGIRVEAWDRAEVAFTGEFKPSSRDEQVKVVFEMGSEGLVVRGEYPKHDGEDGYRGPACAMTLKVPRRSLVELETVNGRISLTGLEGGATCRTVNGAIEAEDLGGGLDARAENGALALIRVRGGLHAVTTNGAVTAKGLDGQGKGIELATTNGAVNVTLARREGSLLASNVNGQLSVATKGAVDVKASKHQVEATFPGSPQAIHVSTVNGALNLD